MPGVAGAYSPSIGLFKARVSPLTWACAVALAVALTGAALLLAGRILPSEPSADTRLERPRGAPAALWRNGSGAGTAESSYVKTAPRAAVTQDAAMAPDALATPEAWAPLAPDAGEAGNGNAVETGAASWYALPGPTASGEAMDETALTAAHPTLPLGTRVRVANLDNGRDVVVRINDRGPFAKDRIIDLSKAAAAALGMIEAGVAEVAVEPVAGEPVAAEPVTAEPVADVAGPAAR